MVPRLLPTALVTVCLLGGCSGGPEYAEVAPSLGAVSSGQARLVFFRESHFAGSIVTLRLWVDGVRVGSLPNGSVLIVDHTPGTVRVRFDQWGSFSPVSFPITAEAGHEYYIELGMRPQCELFLVGVIGCAIADSVADMSAGDHCSSEGWCAALRDRDAALPRLTDLTVEKALGT
jgi:hypothetical protein